MNGNVGPTDLRAASSVNIIKIEPPSGGDQMRNRVLESQFSDIGMAAGFLAMNIGFCQRILMKSADHCACHWVFRRVLSMAVPPPCSLPPGIPKTSILIRVRAPGELPLSTSPLFLKLSIHVRVHMPFEVVSEAISNRFGTDFGSIFGSKTGSKGFFTWTCQRHMKQYP